MSTISALNRVRALKREGQRAQEERQRLVTAQVAPGEAPPDPLDHFDDPQGFCEAFLQVRVGRKVERFRLWAKQGELAKAVLEFRRVACKSGHKIGKSMLAAALAIWWACTRPSARVILTAPTGRQVKKAVWYEIQRFWQSSPRLRAIMPEPALAPETGVRWDDGREIFGFSAENADAVSGPGGPDVLVIIDEASGVPAEVWEALQGVRAGGGKVLALGNPTQTSGWFFEAFHQKRAGWQLYTVSSKDTPNFIEGREVIRGLADRDFEEEERMDHGVTSPIYALRVLGEFPASVANAVIALGMIEQARRLWPETEADGQTVDLGVDVARFGDDDSSVSARIGLKGYSPQWFEDQAGVRAVVNGYDSTLVAGLVVQCIGVLPVGTGLGKRHVRIKVDCTGGYGEPVVAALRSMQDRGDLDPSFDIIPVNFAGESSDPDKFPVLRDELWFSGRPWFRAGGALYPDAKLEGELIAPTYAPDAKGRNKVEPKRETKKRIGRSPDRADSMLLAIYEPPFETDFSVGAYNLGRRF